MSFTPEKIDRGLADLAKAMAVYCVRNTMLEDLHAGQVPVSKTGDGADVTVTDVAGRRLPWNEVSRVSDAEMKLLMQTVVDRLYDVLAHLLDQDYHRRVIEYSLRCAAEFDDPRPIRHHPPRQEPP
jgi:hypothetical protein